VRANLQNANLRNASFRRANLEKANLSDANLQGADLEVSNFQGASFQNSTSLVHHCADGELDLVFTASVTGTQMRVRRQRPPLRVVRAFSPEDATEGAVLVHLHNLSGGVLGGDQLSMRAEVGAEAHVLLTTTGSTRLYRHRPGLPTATQHNHFSVGEGALLEYLPDTLIPFAHSRYSQQTQIELHDGAGLFYWEVVAPGRMASAERFAYDMLHLSLEIQARGRLIAAEQVRLEPERHSPESPVRMGSYAYFATFYICKVGAGVQTWSTLENHLARLAETHTQMGRILWGVSTLPAHGLVVRALSSSLHPITEGLPRFWQQAKQTLYEQQAVLPRKLY
jgi:urease accessory protein